MKTYYFLGANSGKGFSSLYDAFPPDPEARLHIIKAGPGTGKSTFMRKLGETAEKKGMDVEYVLCSGDPHSLDGLYIPQLQQAWVDGTAPHVTEPGLFGVKEDYVNLGKFLKPDFSTAEKQQIQERSRQYKQKYQEAYAALSAAEQLQAAFLPDLFGEKGRSAIARRLHSLLNRSLGPASGKAGRERRCFIRAISCQGDYRLNCEVFEACKQIVALDSNLGALPYALDTVAEEALRRGLDIVSCPSPLRPWEREAVLIPERGLAFVGSEWEFEHSRRVHIDNQADVKLLQTSRAELREGRKLEKKLLELATSKLQQAKALHDDLETFYQKHMDFAALNRFTRQYQERIFTEGAASPPPAGSPETGGLPE